MADLLSIPDMASSKVDTADRVVQVATPKVLRAGNTATRRQASTGSLRRRATERLREEGILANREATHHRRPGGTRHMRIRQGGSRHDIEIQPQICEQVCRSWWRR